MLLLISKLEDINSYYDFKWRPYFKQRNFWQNDYIWNNPHCRVIFVNSTRADEQMETVWMGGLEAVINVTGETLLSCHRPPTSGKRLMLLIIRPTVACTADNRDLGDLEAGLKGIILRKPFELDALHRRQPACELWSRHQKCLKWN